jgi:O-antigen/teichoic acid export membrane protein
MKKLISNLQNSKLVKETFSYTFINVLEKVIPFLLLPVYTRLMSKEDIGYFVLYQALFPLIVPLLTVSLQNAIFLNYFKISKEKFASYFTSIFLLFIGIFCFTGSLFLWFSNEIVQLSGFTSWGVKLLFFLAFFQFVNDLRQGLWRNQRKVRKFGIFTVLLSLLKNSVGLLLILYFGFDWEGILIGHLTGYSVFSLVAIYTFYREDYFSAKLSELKKNFRDGFKISFPLSLHKLSAWLGTTISRVFIANKMGPGFTASFGVASTFNVICTVLFDALNKAYAPALFEKLSRYNSNLNKGLIRMTSIYYIVIIGITVTITIIGYQTVGIIFGSQYESTKYFIIPLTLSAGLNGLYKIHINYIFFSKKTYFITFITVITAALNVPLAYYLIVNHGLLGAAYSMLLTNFIYYILAYLISQKLYPKKFWGYSIKSL